MVRRGKERMPPPADDADADAADAETQVTTQEARWRTGVNRQARPDAQAHQVAAGQASGAKRQANAMTPEEPRSLNECHVEGSRPVETR